MTSMTKVNNMTGNFSIYADLIAAQQAMQPALKQQNNPHLKSKYADLGAVMDACKAPLNEHGFAIIQPLITDDAGRHYVETVLLHTSGDKLSCRIPLIIGKNDMQGLGSAMTYARRYGLMTMAGISPEDDDGEGAKGNGSMPPATNRQPVERQAENPSAEAIAAALDLMSNAVSLDDLASKWRALGRRMQTAPGVNDAKEARKAQLNAGDDGGLVDDEIPY